MPAELDGIITSVLGIDNRPQAQPRIRFAPHATRTYTPVEVGQAYSFPAQATGEGETVGIIELGGGFDTADLNAYFQGLGLTPPNVTAVSVDGGTNSPGTDTNADGEVMLDIEVVGAIAPGASIVVYFAPNTDAGFIDAVSTAVNDTTHRPSVVSISWGGPEDTWTAQARDQMEQILTDAGGLGVTVTAAAGDGGSTDGVDDGQQHVDFPASAPHALACGGTALQATGGQITGETVWNDTGDGSHGRRREHRVRAAQLPERRRRPGERRHRPVREGGPGCGRRRRPARPATRSAWTAAIRRSAARARWRRCGPR